MKSQTLRLIVFSSLLLIGFAQSSLAKRPVQSSDTIPPPPPPELLKLSAAQFTVPRQTEVFPEELSHYLNGCPPVEVWFKISFPASGPKKVDMVYCSRPNSDIERVASENMMATVVGPAAGSDSTITEWYHRMVLVAPGRIVKLESSAVPSPHDLPAPEIAPDSGYVSPKLLEKGKFEVKGTFMQPGFTARAIVKCRISADGKVISARVVASSGNAEFDNTAVSSANRARYEPATRKGVPEVGEALYDFKLAAHR
jgi:TonB family protein